MFPSASVPNCAVSRKANKNIDEGGRCHAAPAPVVIEHDLDVIRNADYVIDMGPGGGDVGGRIVACGTPLEIQSSEDSITGRYL